jgi:hypothetical protein
MGSELSRQHIYINNRFFEFIIWVSAVCEAKSVFVSAVKLLEKKQTKFLFNAGIQCENASVTATAVTDAIIFSVLLAQRTQGA